MRIKFEEINTGEVGVILNALHPIVESNKEALLVQLITLFGNCIGRTAYFTAAADKHYTNLFTIIVGQSSRGRKGQSLNMVKSLFVDACPEWANHCIKKGLSSGEGLIAHIKDKDNDNILTAELPFLENPVRADDKRLLITESEFSSVLKMTQREGNILSQVLRDAWDGVRLETMTKNSPLCATDPMVSMVGHITIAELIRFLNSTEIANGLGNRCVFIKAASDKKLPNPEPLAADLKKYFVNYLVSVVGRAKDIGRMDFDQKAANYWFQLYNKISSNDSSIVGTLTARQEAQIRRLAMIIALINGKSVIDFDSLIFAEKIFDYSIETLKEIYGESMGDPLTDKILDLLRSSDNGLSRSSISEKLNKNYHKGNIECSLKILESQGLISRKKIETAGRPTEIINYNDRTDTKKTN